MSFETIKSKEMGGCQYYGPFLGILNIGCRIIIGIQRTTIILTITQIDVGNPASERCCPGGGRGGFALLALEEYLVA